MNNGSVKISKTDLLVLKYIIDYKEKHCGDSPNLREISENCFLSRQYVHTVLKRIEKFGLINIERNSTKNVKLIIHVASSSWKFSGKLPAAGTVYNF